MFDLGLSATARKQLLHSLTWDHSVRVKAYLLDMSDRVVADLSDRLVDGQVDGAAADGGARFYSTSARTALWDPAHKIGFDTSAPADGQVFVDRMLRVEYEVRVWGLGQWVTIPVFTGPAEAAGRDGPILDVQWLGKERLADKPVWSVVHYQKGSRITTAIRDLLLRAGESADNMDIPDWPDRFPETQVMPRRGNIWERATRYAQIIGARLAYQGDGTVHLQRHSDNVVFTFRDGPSALESHGPTVLTVPKVQFAGDELVNVVEVTGQPKATGAPAPVAVAALPRDHPLNSHRLGRRGSQRILPEFLEDRDIRSAADAQRLADGTLFSRSREIVQVNFDSLPVPFLQAGDMCAVQTAKTIVPTFRLHEYSLPLSHAGVMSIGTRRRVHELSRRRWR